MKFPYAVADHWEGEFQEDKFQSWVDALRSRLGDREASLGLVFMTPRFFDRAADILEIIQLHGRVPWLAGGSSTSLVCNGLEIEENAGLSLGLYSLPGAQLTATHFRQAQVEESTGPAFWHHETGIEAEATHGWLAFVDPFHLDSERWLQQWNEAYPSRTIVGGLASGLLSQPLTQVYLNRQVYEEGGVGISVGGQVGLASVISQGCTPIGDTWTLTGVERNIIQRIGNRPAYEVLAETFHQMSAEEQLKSRGNLFIGLVINEYLEEFHRGDFLIRNLLGADPGSGQLAVGALPRTGQTLQFQRRDAAAATEDMHELLRRARSKLEGRRVYGGCLCSCNGRGKNLFGVPNHDAGLVEQELGPMALTGFFGNGEIGPVGDRNFLHGYTASLALFVAQAD
ncbi:MAG: FIST C-terminal domain-containing protein [Verrucomicrobia bacterium]|jgi:small ligand-binding sensory domain FIST|nr:FIST C-terminal domain-containing protein [Verrucomicrobiota bacterium]